MVFSKSSHRNSFKEKCAKDKIMAFLTTGDVFSDSFGILSKVISHITTFFQKL